MNKQQDDAQTQPNTYEELALIHTALTDLNQKVDTFPQLIEGAVEDILTKRRVMSEDDITKLINAKLANRPTRDEVDKRQIDMFAQFNSALKQSIDSLPPMFKDMIESAIQPLVQKQLELDTKVDHNSDDIKMMRDGHQKQQDLISSIGAQMRQIDKTLTDVNRGLFGESGVKTNMLQNTSKLVEVDSSVKRLQVQHNNLATLRSDFDDYVTYQRQRQQAMYDGAKKFMKWVAPVVVTGLVGSEVAGRFLLSVFNALGF